MQNKQMLNFNTPDNLREYLKVQNIKSELNDEIISNSIDEILEVIGPKNELLDFIVRHSPADELNAIYSILQKRIQKFKADHKHDFISSPSTTTATQHSNFDEISCESIENICSFLERRDINNLKRTSRRISIVCLNEMTKYSIKICIAKKLLNSESVKKIKWDIHNTSTHRYKITTKYSFIFQQLEDQHQISEKYQIPIAINKDARVDYLSDRHYFEPQPFQSIPRRSSLILFDKRDVALLNTESTNEFNYDKHSILTLHYFDIHKQKITMVKQLAIDDSVTMQKLSHYIKTVLISQNTTQKYNTLKELDTPATPFAFHRLDSHLNPLQPIISPHNKKKIMSLVFQINPINATIFRTLQSESEMTLLQKFHIYASDMLQHHNKRDVQIEFACKDMAALKQNITDYMVFKNIFTEEAKTHVFETIEKSLNANATLSCDYSLHSNVIGKYVSKFIMNEIIPPDYIIIDCGQLKYSIHRIIRSPNKIYVSVKPSKRDIKIYSQLQAPFPYHYKEFTSQQLKPTITAKLFIKNEESVNDIVSKLVNDPSINTQDIKTSFDKYTNSVTPQCYAIINRTIYQPNDRHLMSDKPMKLFFLPFQNQNSSKHIKLMIRFSWRKTFNAKVSVSEINNSCAGLPLAVFINKADTLQHLLRNNILLQKFRRSIQYVYKVDVNQQKMTSVPESKRDQYKLWKNVLSQNSKNFIVIKIKNRSGGTMYGNQQNLPRCKLA